MNKKLGYQILELYAVFWQMRSWHLELQLLYCRTA